MKNFLGKWTRFELIFLICSEIIITVCFVFGADKNLFSYIVSVVGVISMLMVAKGLTIAPIINVAYCVIYSVLSISQKYYGEAIVGIGLMIPIYVVSIVSWIKNRNKEHEELVSVNKISRKEYLILAITTVFVTIGFYYLLKVLNTGELVVSTLSLITSAVASYLMLRRCSYYALGFIANDFILITLWSLAVSKSGFGFLPNVICFCVFLINDIYGFIHWKREEKRQAKS